MIFYKSLNRKYGYNIRFDSDTKCIVSNETKLLQSESRKKRKIKFPNLSKDISKKVKLYYTNNPDKMKDRQVKVSKTRTKHHFYQYDKTNKKLIKIWDTMLNILTENPSYKRGAIYKVCYNKNHTAYGYIWEKIKIVI